MKAAAVYVAILIALALASGSLAGAAYVDDARYAAAQARDAFFREDGAALAYALKSLTTACLSEEMSSISPTPSLPPLCDAYVDLLREGCAPPDASSAQFACAGRLVEREVTRERGWNSDLLEVLRQIDRRVHAAGDLVRTHSGKR